MIVHYGHNDNESTTVIPIHCPSDNPPPEYAMIEINGELIAPTELPSKENQEIVLGGMDRLELGRLQLGPDEKTPMLILGGHLLKGKVETLKEPFCVMKKNYNEHDEIQAYDVVGVVNTKLIFAQYPKVIMR